MSISSRWLTAILSVGSCALWSSIGMAQDKWCFRDATSVPSTSPDVTDANVLDGDIGWSGSFVYHAGDGADANTDAVMHSLKSGNNFFFAFRMVRDSAINPESDVIAIGFQLADLSYRQILIQPFPGGSDCLGPAVTFTSGPVTVFVSKPGTVASGVITYGDGGVAATSPPWVTGSRHCTVVSPGNYEWRVEARLDLGAAGWTLVPSSGTTANFFASAFRGLDASSAVAYSWPAGAPVGSFAPVPPFWVDLSVASWGTATYPGGECRGVRAQPGTVRTNQGSGVLPGAFNRFLVDVENTGSTPADVSVTFKHQDFGLSGNPYSPIPGGVAAAASVPGGTAASPGVRTFQTPAPGWDVPAGASTLFGSCIIAEMASTDTGVVFVQRSVRGNIGYMPNPTVGRKLITVSGRAYPPGPLADMQQLHLEAAPRNVSYTFSDGNLREVAFGHLVAQDSLLVRAYRVTGRRALLGGKVINLREPAGYFGINAQHLLEIAKMKEVLAQAKPILGEILPTYTGEPTVPELYRVAPPGDQRSRDEAVAKLTRLAQRPENIVGLHPEYFYLLPEASREALLRPLTKATEALKRGGIAPPAKAWRTTLRQENADVDYLDPAARANAKPLMVPAEGEIRLEIAASYVDEGPPCGCCCRRSTGGSPAEGASVLSTPLLLVAFWWLRRGRPRR